MHLRLLGRLHVVSVVISTALLLFSFHASAQASPSDAQIQADENKQLDNKRLRDVKAQVSGGLVVLTGTVQTLHDKLEAGRRSQKVHNVASLRNEIQVTGGTEVSDQALGEKLAGKLTLNQQNPDRTAFQYVSVSVQNGIVRITGLVTQPIDKQNIEGVVEDQEGAKELVDNIQVAPLSPNDDRVRLALYRAIYGYQAFTKYAVNPGKSIRILVVNGNATLVGVVDNKGDKDLAGMRANGVSGVFKVTNDLRVQGQRE